MALRSTSLLPPTVARGNCWKIFKTPQCDKPMRLEYLYVLKTSTLLSFISSLSIESLLEKAKCYTQHYYLAETTEFQYLNDKIT